jgi:small subunit ribosomal protein S16
MLTIRLQRIGKAKYPQYRLIISEKARDTQGTYLENLGTYNPHAKENQFIPKADRIKYWLEKGASTSDTIHNLLVKNSIIKGEKKKSVYLSTKRKAKVAEKQAEKQKAAAAASAAATPAA